MPTSLQRRAVSGEMRSVRWCHGRIGCWPGRITTPLPSTTVNPAERALLERDFAIGERHNGAGAASTSGASR